MIDNKQTELISNAETGLRQPDLSIGGLEIWINGRQFPESEDYWDGNWLDTTARCSANSAVVYTSGPIIHLSELHSFKVECKRIYETLSGEAKLECMESYIGLRIRMRSVGQCELVVSITPDHLYQEHTFIFDLDQSYLPHLLQGLEQILRSYPIIGSKQ